MSSQEKCSNCKSYDLRITDKSKRLQIGFSCLILGVSLYYLGYLSDSTILVFGLVGGIASIVVGIYYLVLGFYSKRVDVVCKSCKMKYIINNV